MTREEIRAEINKRGCLDSQHFLGTEGPYRLQQNINEFTEYIFFLRQMFPNGIGEYLAIGVAAAGDIRTVNELVGIKHATVIDLGVFDPDVQAMNLKAIGMEKITLFHGNSHSDACKTFLAGIDKRFDLIFIDGDHSYRGALMDTEMVLPYCHEETLIGFHDVEIDNSKVSKIACDDIRASGAIDSNPIHPDGIQGSNLAYQDAIAKGWVKQLVKFFDAQAKIPIGIGVTRKIF